MKGEQTLTKILGFLFITTYSNAKYLLVEVEDRIVGQGEALGGKDLQELPPQEGIYLYSFRNPSAEKTYAFRASRKNNA